MIFATVGNDFRPFDRLIKKVDEIAPALPEETLIQKGVSTYCPQHSRSFDFVPMETAADNLRKARLVISHGGIGTILLCKAYGTPLIIVPRRKTFQEHMNDHQVEIARMLEERKDRFIHVLYELDRLKETILDHWDEKRDAGPDENKGKSALVDTLREFLRGSSP